MRAEPDFSTAALAGRNSRPQRTSQVSSSSQLSTSGTVAPPLVEIDGYGVNVSSLSQAVELVSRRIAVASSFFLCTLNLDHLVKLRKSPDFRQAYKRAEFVTADGFPIVMLARIRGQSLQRTTGSDLIEPLCRMAERNRLPVFFLGTTFSVLAEVARRLRILCPSLEISGVYAPPLNFTVGSTEAETAIEFIRSSGCRICFVALGAPLQELFALRASAETTGVCFLPIGAGLDFLAGSRLRAPRFLQTVNLEWAWRLAQDPRRLWLRYVRCGILFLELLLSESVGVVRRRLRGVSHV